jgi:hypothetical protein
MAEYARVTPTSQVLIDTGTWITAPTGGVLTELTSRPHQWALQHTGGDMSHPSGLRPDGARFAGSADAFDDWVAVASAWCEQLTAPRG